jgi:predicted nuclease of restriction endonuclease-like RecB superfamily
MLPSNLLRAKISAGKIRPLYASLDLDTIALAERISGIFRDATGKRRGELLEKLRDVEEGGNDFKLIRGLSTLLERRCEFEAETAFNPKEARMAVFEEASRRRTSSLEARNGVIQTVSTKLGISPEAMERTLFSDLEDEVILRDFKPLDAQRLLKQYNLSVTQTLLFKSLRVEFTASGNWKNIFRDVKRFGLIYSVERGNDGGFKISLDGPLSLFKMTERYGTSIAKILPQIVASDSWSIRAEILARSRGRVYTFEADGSELNGIILSATDSPRDGVRPSLYDSTIEERFARSFLSYGSGWVLKREPEPLVTGTHVLIPDFSFEKNGAKVYLEVVGFWTSEYLERKINKLKQVTGIDMIVAADKSLACSKLERLKSNALVIYYEKEVPLKPIIEHLKERDRLIVKDEVKRFRTEEITLTGDVVSLDEIARKRGVTLESVRTALADFKPYEYARVGDLFLSRTKLDEIDEKLRGVQLLTGALQVIEDCGVKGEGQKVLDALGYASVWEGMEMDKVRISKQSTATSESARLSN